MLCKRFRRCICLLLLCGINAHAQKITSHDLLMGGVYLGIGGHFYSGNFDVFQGGSSCGVFTTGGGWQPELGVLTELPISGKFSFTPRLLWENRSGSFLTTPPVTPDILISGSPAPISLQHKLATTIRYATVDALLKWLPFKKNNFYFLGGGTFAVNTAASFTQTESILSPNNAVFTTNGQQDRTLASGNFTTTEKLQYALGLGMGFDIPLSHKLFLAPEMYTAIGLNHVLSDASWSIVSLRFTVSLKMNFTEPFTPAPVMEAEESPAQSSLEEPPPAERQPLYPPPTAAFSIFGLTPTGDQVPNPSLKVEEFVTTEFQPMLNYIFFDSAGAVMPARYVRIRKQDIENFSDTAMLASGAIELYYNTLNFVGKRMQEYPDATLTITGCNSNESGEENNTALSRRRAEAVRNYLVDIWGVPPERITVKAQNLPDVPSRTGTSYGDQENRRVEIWSSDPHVISPLTLAGLERQVSLPYVRFYLHSDADSLIKKWSIEASENGKEITSLDSSGRMPASYDMLLSRFADTLIGGEGPMRFTLTVQDSSGRKSSASTEMKFEALTIKQKREQHIADKTVNKYRLFLFDFDQANLTAKNKEVLSLIDEEIKSSSTVTVYGFADRTGEAKHNQDLSEQRAQAVGNFIRDHAHPANIVMEGKGDSDLLYNNDLPEGRFFTRTVFVQIETPIGEDEK